MDKWEEYKRVRNLKAQWEVVHELERELAELSKEIGKKEERLAREVEKMKKYLPKKEEST